MAERNEDLCRVQLKDVILSYPTLFRPKAFGDGDGEPAYSANFLLDKGTKAGKHNIALIEDAIEEAKHAKWGNKPPKIKSDKVFFKDGDTEDFEDAEENHGMMIVTSRNYKKPRTLDRDKQDCVEADDILYGGARVDAIVRVWAQDNKWGVRINCSLEAVRFRDDGDRFGSAPVDPDEFEDLPSDGKSRSRRDRDDEDDDRGSSRSRRGRDKDDDEDRGSSRSRRGRDKDEEEDEKPSRSRRNRDEEQDEKPSRSRRSRDDDEDEKPSRSRRARDDDEDEKPSRSRRGRDEEEDEKPSRSRRARDEDDDEDRPSRNSRSRRDHDV